MSKTWTQIRQELSRRLNEPVMRRVGTEISVAGAIAANSFHSTALGNLTNDWGVAYGSAFVSYTTDGLAPLGQELEIQSFRSNGSIGYAYTGGQGFIPALGANDRVEIHEFFTVRQLLDATNQAIRDSWPAFYTITKDESIILEKFKREYDLTTLAVRPRHLIGAYIEPVFRVGIGSATDANETLIEDTRLTLALEVNKTYHVVIYYGVGAGQERVIGNWDAVGHVISPTVQFDPAPHLGDEFMVKNMSDVYYNWLGPLAKIRLDQSEDPTTIEILYDTYELWGARLRLEYASPVPELVGEASTLPDSMVDYVITRALYYLYMQNIGRTAQFDVKTAATLADQYDKQSEALRDRNRMKRLNSTIRTDAQYMNWSDREMPFKR